MNEPILIAGGGIGGLAAALGFAHRDFEVMLFERAAGFEEVGAGIQLSANCTRVLLDLGLGPALAPIAFLPERTEFRHWKSGRLLAATPLGDAATARFGAPYYHVHRADLIRLLADAAAAEPRIRLHVRASVDGFVQDEAGVTITAGGETHRGSLLVGADGIHSTVRAALFGAESPTFTGNVAWRALVPASRLPAGRIRPVAGVWWGPHKHFVHYYVRAGELINCVCVVEKAGWEVESWTAHGDHTELVADFAGWHPDIRLLIDSMDRDACFKWALFDRPPMPSWGLGRVTLLGDACHPTLPFMAQGAAMAIEDGAVLAHCVGAAREAGGSTTPALARYQALRMARTARIQAGSRRNARVFHLTGIGAWARNRAASRASRGAMDWLYSYDALNIT
ncbi:MAG: FAD-dependent monooxygenase [Pseudomonadales bacterium]|jgi:salicylate hydroxylase